jgi:hypothetical protein
MNELQVVLEMLQLRRSDNNLKQQSAKQTHSNVTANK